TSITIARDTTIDQVISIDLTGISSGFHTLFVRVRDNSGMWSLANAKPFYLEAGKLAAENNITAAEYFLDTDPGYGSGTPVGISPDSTLDHLFTVDLTGLASGFHTLFVRIQDANGLWSLAHAKPFYLEAGKLAVENDITAAEYFLDSDPGFGNGASVGIIPDSTLDQLFMVDLDTLSTGLHTLFVRVRDANGLWSLAHAKPFYLDAGKLAVENNIVAAEYFVDTDPGYGQGEPIAISSDSSINQVFMIDLDMLATGFHTLFVRVRDAAGYWSLAQAKPFYLDFDDLSAPNLSSINYFFTGGNDFISSVATYSNPLPSSNIDAEIWADLSELEQDSTYQLHITARDERGRVSMESAHSVLVAYGAFISVSLDTLPFSYLNIDSTTTLSFVVRNQGTPDSILTIMELALSCSDFTAHADTTSIISGDSTLVMVTFSPTAPQVYGCDLTIRSNALDYPELTVHLQGRSSNSAPEARPDTVITDEDIGVLINVLANDQDVDDAYLAIERFSQPSFGAASVTKAGLVAYTPSANYYGTDSLSYVVTDGHEAYDTASVSITIWPVNDPPGDFHMISIARDSVVQLTTDMLTDSLTFSWTPAIDVEGDTVTYHFELGDTLALVAFPNLNDTLVSVRFDSLAIWIRRQGDVSISGTWDLLALDGLDTNWVQDGPFVLTIDLSTLDILDLLGLPKEFALHQNYPNPFNPLTTIRFDLPVATDVKLMVYDILGRNIVRLVHQTLEPGYRSVVWQGLDNRGRLVPSGIYIVRLVTPEYTRSIKMVLLK
ncbi:Ig-like domain-containing protein, partial [Candidatus Neomarinimicrobiota bacterium]